MAESPLPEPLDADDADDADVGEAMAVDADGLGDDDNDNDDNDKDAAGAAATEAESADAAPAAQRAPAVNYDTQALTWNAAHTKVRGGSGGSRPHSGWRGGEAPLTKRAMAQNEENKYCYWCVCAPTLY